MAETPEKPEKDPLEELFSIYKERTGESILDRFFRLREEHREVEPDSDGEDDEERAFWEAATEAAKRQWRDPSHD